jgi:hypothetical protein
MSTNKKTFSQADLSGCFTSIHIADGKAYIPIPLQQFITAGISLDLPIGIASLDIGGIYVHNINIHNPDLVKSIINPLIK